MRHLEQLPTGLPVAGRVGMVEPITGGDTGGHQPRLRPVKGGGTGWHAYTVTCLLARCGEAALTEDDEMLGSDVRGSPRMAHRLAGPEYGMSAGHSQIRL